MWLIIMCGALLQGFRYATPLPIPCQLYELEGKPLYADPL